MKKLLLATSGLISAVALSSAAHAENPKVTLGGFTTFEAGFISDDLTDSTLNTAGTAGDNQRGHGFRNDTEISIHVDGRTDLGLGYGAVIDLEADVASDNASSSDAQNQGFNASRTFVYLDGGWGRFEMGSTEGPQDTLKIDASSIARASGGIDGDWWYFANAGGSFIATPDLPVAHGTGVLGSETQNNATKISYYTPRFSGFQAGVAYTPDADDRGQLVSRVDTGGTVGEIISGGLTYDHQFSAFTLGLSLTGEMGDSETPGTDDLEAYAAGAKVGFAGFTVAGSYGQWEENPFFVGGDDSDYYTLGAAFEAGPFGVSVSWLDSSLDLGATENDFENLVIGADWKWAEGVTPFVELSLFDADVGGSAALDNDGTIGIVGIDFNF